MHVRLRGCQAMLLLASAKLRASQSDRLLLPEVQKLDLVVQSCIS